MKIVKNIIRLCAAALAVLPIFGCSEEEYVKPSALLSESSLTFEAIGAEPQSLTIASESWRQFPNHRQQPRLLNPHRHLPER